MTDSSTTAEPSDPTGAQLPGPPQPWPAPPQAPVARSPKLGRVAMVMAICRRRSNAAVTVVMAICVISTSVLMSVLLGLFGTTVYEYGTNTSAGFSMRPDQTWFAVQMLLGSVVGIWALTQGIVAAAQNRGRRFGVVAIVLAGAAPLVSLIVWVALGFAFGHHAQM